MNSTPSGKSKLMLSVSYYESSTDALVDFCEVKHIFHASSAQLGTPIYMVTIRSLREGCDLSSNSARFIPVFNDELVAHQLLRPRREAPVSTSLAVTSADGPVAADSV